MNNISFDSDMRDLTNEEYKKLTGEEWPPTSFEPTEIEQLPLNKQNLQKIQINQNRSNIMFIKLILHKLNNTNDNEQIYVNVNNINVISKDLDGGSLITFSNDTWNVKETPDEIVKLIDNRLDSLNKNKE